MLLYVKKRLCAQKWIFLFALIICAMFMTFLTDFFVSNRILANGQKRLREGFRNSIEQVGVASFEDLLFSEMSLSNKKDLLWELSNREEIAGIGHFELAIARQDYISEEKDPYHVWEKIFSIQSKAQLSLPRIDERVIYVLADLYCLPLFDLKLINGDTIENSVKPGTFTVFLGYNFRSIPVGTQFKKSIGDGEEITYLVGGILQKDTVMPIDISSNGSLLKENEYNKAIKMDNYFIIVCNEDYSYPANNRIMFSNSTNSTFEDAEKAIADIAQKYNLGVEFEKFSHYLEEQDSVIAYRRSFFSRVFCALAVACFFVCVSIQLFALFTRKDEISLWLICGTGYKRIYFALFIENMVKCLTAHLLSIAVSTYYWRQCALEKGHFNEVFCEVFLKKDVFLLGLSIGFSLLISMIPFMYFKSRSRMDLIKGEWNKRIRNFRMKLRGDVFINILLILSFAVTSGILYFAFDFIRQDKAIKTEQIKSFYEEDYMMNCTAPSMEIHDVDDIPIPNITQGNLYISTFTKVGESLIGRCGVEILWIQNEDLLETIHYFDYSESISGAKCVVGKGNLDKTYELDGCRYISLGSIQCQVAGYFEPITFEQKDNRVLVFGDSLSKDEQNALLLGDDRYSKVLYKKVKYTEQTEVDEFVAWASEIFDERFFVMGAEILEPFYEDTYGLAVDYNKEIKHYLRTIYLMLLFAIFNGAFLTIIWIQNHSFEINVKKIMGYSDDRLVFDITKMLIWPEIYAFVSFSLISFIIECTKKRFAIWCKNMSTGILSFLLLYLFLGIVFAMISIKFTRKKASEIFKYTE